MSWDRKDHQVRTMPTAGAAINFDVIDIGPQAAVVRRAPVPEQSLRQLARRQRNHAGVYAQREVLAALAHAQGAIEPKETPLERAMRWLREWRAGL